MRRFFFFFAINILIVLTASFVALVVMRFFNIQGDLPFYAIFYSILGFGGAFVSLSLSRWMAKRMMGVRIIDPRSATGQDKELVEMVHRLSRKARLPAFPEVGIYEKKELNAFATGPSKKRSLVACSRGLLSSMDKEELEGVLGHEIAHIKNGDMVTMTLLQGLINTMVLLAARLLTTIILSKLRRRSFWLELSIYMGLQMVFSIFGTIFLCYFSRAREYRADQGGAKLAGSSNMIKALKALQRSYSPVQDSSGQQQASYNYLKISGKPKRNLFSTHPPLEERIKKLERYYS